MRKLFKKVMGGVALALMLGGCGMSGDDGQQEQKMDRQETETGQEGAETVSVTDIRKLQELAQRDNSLDAYSAVRHAFLPSERPEEELMEAFFNVALGENSAACYARYIPMNPEEQRDEFAVVTTEGDEGLIDLTGNKSYSGMGTALGKDQYFLYGGSDGAYSIYEVDGEMQLLKELQLDFLGSSGTEYEYIEQLIYRAAVVEFNRRYPTCHINMKSYDRDALLTELSAGKGPVLIDTQMTGFADKEAMWEPIEKVLQQLGVMDNLVDKAMDQGRINGTLYGIVMDFYLETVVTADMELTDWDYDSFLRLLSEREDLKAVMNSYAGDDGWYFILQFFIQDMEDNYLLDAETATTHFDSEEFRTILHFAKDYCERKDFVDAVEGLEDGQVFCNVITITRPDQLALYRLAYGDRVNYIGFPSGNGAKTVINCVEPMVMRKNATKEEKELAYAFLEILLSEEIQSEAANDLNYKLSSRKDVLAEQLANVSEDDLPNAPGFEPITLNGAIDYEKDAELLYRLLEKAEPKTGFPGSCTS